MSEDAANSDPNASKTHSFALLVAPSKAACRLLDGGPGAQGSFIAMFAETLQGKPILRRTKLEWGAVDRPCLPPIDTTPLEPNLFRDVSDRSCGRLMGANPAARIAVACEAESYLRKCSPQSVIYRFGAGARQCGCRGEVAWQNAVSACVSKLL